jgi:hypothetical protein
MCYPVRVIMHLRGTVIDEYDGGMINRGKPKEVGEKPLAVPHHQP